MAKKTKIVATIGPASEKKAVIGKMIASGMNVARLNFSHGTYRHHAQLIETIHAAAKKAGKRVAIMQDLQGPRIRTGDIAAGGIELTAGDEVVLVSEQFDIPKIATVTHIPIQYPNLYKDVKSGDPILIDDGKVVLKVLSTRDKKIKCRVQIGDVLTARRGMNFPKSSISAPALTEKDLKDLAFGIKQGVDFVALSFVKTAADVQLLRRHIAKLEKKSRTRMFGAQKTETKIIAKIERPEAVKNFEHIAAAADGIMVARGDLGLELPVADLPSVQKKIIRRCIQLGKPVIVATQMLDSMIKYPTPTRAEISDVANAVLDGADAIMLSGETATGKYPVKTVQVMRQIAVQAESAEVKAHEQIETELKKITTAESAIAYACQEIAEDSKARAIVCVSADGELAAQIAKYRTKIPLLVLARTEKTVRQLCLTWGVEATGAAGSLDFAKLSEVALVAGRRTGVPRKSAIVFVARHPSGWGTADTIKVMTT